MATNNQYYLEKIQEVMRDLRTFMAEEFERARLKSNPKRERKVLLCGYTEADDCFCVSTGTMESGYDLDDAAVVLEEEMSYQSQLKNQQDGASIISEEGDNDGLLAKLEDPSPQIHQACEQGVHDTVNSLPKNGFSSLSLTNNTVIGAFDANIEEFHVASKVFDKSTERKLATNKEFSGKELLRMVIPRKSAYHCLPKSTLLAPEDSTIGNVKLLNISQANHIVKDANYQGIKECSHVLENEFVDEISPEPPDDYATPSQKSIAGLETLEEEGILVKLVGAPGSGKSTFCKDVMHISTRPWFHVCQDTIGNDKARTKVQCLTSATTVSKDGKSVFIDRYNLDREQRANLMKFGGSHGDVHAVVLDLPAKLCISRSVKCIGHEGNLQGGKADAVVNRILQRKELPKLSEGFSRITFCQNESDVQASVNTYGAFSPLDSLPSDCFGQKNPDAKVQLGIMKFLKKVDTPNNATNVSQGSAGNQLLKENNIASEGSENHTSPSKLGRSRIMLIPDHENIPIDAIDVWEIDARLLKFEHQIAFGSFADLYKGILHGPEVTIKCLQTGSLNADGQRKFAQEVYIFRKVRHRNVVQLIGACTRPPNLYIVTEFKSSGSLYASLHKQIGFFRLPTTLKVTIDVSKGMNYLHQNNIIHRDLEAANLLIGENEVVKVVDFGVTRVQAQSGVMTAETGYNVFNFGIVLWELLTGKLPYENLTPVQTAFVAPLYWDQDDPYEMVGDHCFIAGGNWKLIKALCKGLPIFYGKTVQTIRYGNVGVEIIVGNQVFHADTVLCTVPLEVLKKRTIRFEPKLLQRKLAAIDRLGFGLLNKVVMIFSHVFSGEDLDTFGCLSKNSNRRGEFFLFYSYHTVFGGSVLVALVAGEAARSFEYTSPSTLLHHALSVLRGICGPKGVDVPNSIQFICTRWEGDPLSYGSYSHMRVQLSGGDYDILAESVGSRLFFAGEATNWQHPATILGAYLSGLREAPCILRTTRAQQCNPKKCLQKYAGPSNLILVNLLKKPDLTFGKFQFIYDRSTEDPKSMALMRVTFERSSSEYCYKKETENSYEQSLNQPVHLYTVLSREQVHELQLVARGYESKLSYLLENIGLKLMGADALGTLGNSLTANIASARRGRIGIAILLGNKMLSHWLLCHWCFVIVSPLFVMNPTLEGKGVF